MQEHGWMHKALLLRGLVQCRGIARNVVERRRQIKRIGTGRLRKLENPISELRNVGGTLRRERNHEFGA